MIARKLIPVSERCARTRCCRKAVQVEGEKGPKLCLTHAAKVGKARYPNRRVVVAGRSWPSAWHAEWAQGLIDLQEQGEVTDLKFEVPFELRVNGVLIERYYADATYFLTRTKESVIADAKNGLLTKDYMRKRKWMKATGREITEFHKRK